MLGPVTNAEHAVRSANLFTRLQTISAAPPAAAMVKVADDVTPFLGERNIGKDAWRVEYRNSSLKFATALVDFTDPYRRTFTVLLKPDNGRLLFVASTYEGPRDPDMRAMPNCGVATEQLSNEEEVYDGYPDEYPTIDFLAALESILNGGSGSPFQAKEIHGAYVMHSRMGSLPRPAWAVTLRGLPPRPVRSPSVPAWQRNHMRNVIDATTGKVLFATNSPQPV